METSSNRNIFRITGPFVRGVHRRTGGFPSQRPVTRSLDVFFHVRLDKRLSKNRDAGNLRRHHAHYDVTVMTQYIVLQWYVTYLSSHQQSVMYNEHESELKDISWQINEDMTEIIRFMSGWRPINHLRTWIKLNLCWWRLKVSPIVQIASLYTKLEYGR